MQSSIGLLLLIVCSQCLHRVGIDAFSFSTNKLVSDDFGVPCKYQESIAVSELVRFARLQNESATTDSVLGGLNDTRTGYFDYEILNSTYRRSVPSHLRACVCQKRPCARLLCARGDRYKEAENKQVCAPDEHVREFNITLQNEDGSSRSVPFFDHFGYTLGKPCGSVNMLMPADYEMDIWTIDEQGTVLNNGKVLDQTAYALMAYWDNQTGRIDVAMYLCFEPYENYGRFEYLPFSMLTLSVPFLIITFIVYAILPELRNLHGKTLMCYLVCLANGQTVLAFLQIYPDKTSWFCRPGGFVAYFWFLAAFIWLNVISFDLWWTFRHIRALKGRTASGSRRFAYYSIYAWGLALIALIILYTMDTVPSVPKNMRPAIGFMNCFIQPNRWIEFFYFHMPLMIIFVANTVFFAITFTIIRRVKEDISRITSMEDSRRTQSHFEKEKDSYGMFLRMFVVMGVQWMTETISFLIDPVGLLFFITDFINTISGLVIFVLFVMKPNVKKLLIKKFAFLPIIRNISTSSSAPPSSNLT